MLTALFHSLISYYYWLLVQLLFIRMIIDSDRIQHLIQFQFKSSAASCQPPATLQASKLNNTTPLATATIEVPNPTIEDETPATVQMGQDLKLELELDNWTHRIPAMVMIMVSQQYCHSHSRPAQRLTESCRWHLADLAG